jgi:hypothetical protein
MPEMTRSGRSVISARTPTFTHVAGGATIAYARRPPASVT